MSRVLNVATQAHEIFAAGGATAVRESGDQITFDGSAFQLVSSHIGNTPGVFGAGIWEMADPAIAGAAESRGAIDTWRRYAASARLIGSISVNEDPFEPAGIIYRIHDAIPLTNEDGSPMLDEAGQQLTAANAKNFTHAWIRLQNLWVNTGEDVLGLSEDELDELYTGSRIGYQTLGLETDPLMPEERGDLPEAIETLAGQAERTRPVAHLLEHGVEAPHIVPNSIWERTPVGLIGRRLANIATRGTLPDTVREKLDLKPLNRRERYILNSMQLWLAEVADTTPQVRWHPRIAEKLAPPRTPSEHAALLANRLIVWAVAGPEGPRPTQKKPALAA